MILSLRIWVIAQLLHCILALIFFQEVGLFISLFAAIGGIPAIFLFWLPLLLVRHIAPHRYVALGLVLFLLPVCTWLCAWATATAIDMQLPVAGPFMVIPVAATVLSVLLHTRGIFRLLPHPTL